MYLISPHIFLPDSVYLLLLEENETAENHISVAARRPQPGEKSEGGTQRGGGVIQAH